MKQDFTHNPNNAHEWLSMSEAASLTPYSAEYLSLLARKKKLTAKKVGKTWYTTRPIVEEYMKRQMIRNQIQNGNLASVDDIAKASVQTKAALEEIQSAHIAETTHTKLFTPAPEVIPVPETLSALEAQAPQSKSVETPVVDAQVQHVPVQPRVENHPLTKKVRTFHADLKAYLDELHGIKPQIEVAPTPVATPDTSLNVLAEQKTQALESDANIKLSFKPIETVKEAPVSDKHTESPVSSFIKMTFANPFKSHTQKVAPKPLPSLSTATPRQFVNVPAVKTPAKAPEAVVNPVVSQPAQVVQNTDLDTIAKTLARISERVEVLAQARSLPTHEFTSATEAPSVDFMQALDQKFASLGIVPVRKNIVTRSFDIVLGHKALVGTAMAITVFFTLFPTPFVHGFFDKTVSAAKKLVTDAHTVMGFRPGTHENEILLLDKQGNISIMGHIETDGQFRSYAKDGIAPIVVDSRTEVKNLNAEMVGGMKAQDFTLAYVTKNGNVTTEDVYFEGQVEVGKTLLVKGATKLLNNLSVDGNLAVFGDAKFSKSLTVSGPAFFETLINAQAINVAGLATFAEVTTTDNLSVGKNIYTRGSIEAGQAVVARQGLFGSGGYNGDFTASGKVALGGNSSSIVTIRSKNANLDKNGNLDLNGSLSLDGDLTLGGVLTAGTVVFSSTSIGDLVSTNSSTTNATTTNFYTSVARIVNGVIDTLTATVASITTLVANDITVGALTATNTTAVNSTTTNATSTNQFAQNFVAINATTTTLYSQSATIDAASIINAVISNLSSASGTIANLASTNASLVNATTTNATSTNQFVQNFVATNATIASGTVSNLSFTNATGTNATTTSLYSIVMKSLFGTIETFDSMLADIANLTVVNSTTTNATTTNLNTTNITTTNASTTNLLFINATGTAATTTNFFSTTASSTNLFSSLLAVGGNTLVTTASGNVGIGTTSPLSRFEVANDSSSWLGYDTSGHLTLRKDGSNRPRINLRDEGGFGESSVDFYSYNLVTGGATQVIPTARWSMVDAGSYKGSHIFYTSTGNSPNQPLLERMRISGDGNVGIGTTSPSQTLSVQGNGLFSGNITAANITATGTLSFTNLLATGSSTLQNFTFLNATGTAATTTNFYASNLSSGNLITSGTARIGSTLTLSGFGVCSGSQALQTDSNGNVVCAAINVNGASSGGGWYTNNIGSVLLSTTTDQVGVGATSSPYAKLSVLSGNTATTTLALVASVGQVANILDIYNNSGVLSSVISASGNMGIGTTSPQAKLELSSSQGTAFEAMRVVNWGASDNSYIYFQRPGFTDRGLTIGHQATFATTSSIRASGGVSENLELKPGLNLLGNPGQIHLLSGNVGIGTTSPSQILSVQGNGLFSGDITAANIIATGTLSFANLLATGSSTLQNFTFLNATGTAATTTNFFSNTASSTNLFTSLFSAGGNTLVTTASGNVGVGTNNPLGRFQVDGITASNPGKIILTDDGNYNPIFSMYRWTGSSNTYMQTSMVNNNGSLYLQTGSGSGAVIGSDTQSTRLAIVASTGNVGINSTNPLAKLEIQNGDGNLGGTAGQIAFAFVNGGFRHFIETRHNTAADDGNALTFWLNTSGSAAGSSAPGTGNSKVLDLGYNTQRFYTAGVERLIINSSGNVGVGTSTPNQKLVVAGGGLNFISFDPAGGNDATIRLNRNSSSNYYGARFSQTGAWTSTWELGYFGGSPNAADFTLYDGGVPRFTFATGGNVGVGTTSPFAKLSVAGDGYFDGNITATNITATGTLSFANLLATGSSTLQNFTFLNATGTAATTTNFYSTTASSTNLSASLLTVGGNALTVNSSRNVGIGTATPVTRFSVNQPGNTVAAAFAGSGGGAVGIGSSARPFIQGYTNDSMVSSQDLILQPNTNTRVGIGTSTPANILDVYGPVNPRIRITSPAATAPGIEIVQNGQTGWTMYQPGSSSDLRFAQASDLITFSNGGNIGIGTTSPTSKLSIDGSGEQLLSIASSGTGARVYAMVVNPVWSQGSFNIYDKTSDLARITVTSAGNVGIGTTSPYQNFAVSGNAIITGNLQVSNGAGQATPSLVLREGDTDTGIYSPGTDEVGITTAGSVKLTVKSTGNVGIGTTSPIAKLSVAGDGYFDGNITATNITATGTLSVGGFNVTGTATTTFAGDILAPGIAAWRYLTAPTIQATSTTGTSTFAGGATIAGSSGLVVQQNGNVSVGALAPSNQKFSVNGIAYFTNGSTGLNISGGNITTQTSADAVSISAGSTLAFGTYTSGSFNEKARFSNAGSFGIATTSPGAALSVNGNALVSGSAGSAATFIGLRAQNTDANGSSRIAAVNDNGSSISLRQNGSTQSGGGAVGLIETSNAFQLTTGGNTAITVDTSQRVGIGTTTPDKALTVAGNGTLQAMFRATAPGAYAGTYFAHTASGALGYISLGDSSVSNTGIRDALTIGTATAHPFRIMTSDTARFTVDASGNVGVGTTSPVTNLSVNGTGYFTNSLGIGAVPTNGVEFDIVQSLSGSNLNQRIWNQSNTAGSNATIDLSVGGSSAGNPFSTYTVAGVTSWALGLDNAASDSFKISNNNTLGTNDYLTITTAGNVGVGTTSPNSQLQVYGAGQLTANITDAGARTGTINITGASNAAGAGGALLFSSINDNGNNNPQAAIKSLLANGGGNGVGSLAFSVRTNTSDTALTEAMRITSAGNVGIGTTSPATLLHIAGIAPNIRFEDTATTIKSNIQSSGGVFSINADTGNGAASSRAIAFNLFGTEYARLNYTGNFGIGTNTPAQRLSVQGDALISGNLTAANITATGTLSVASITTTSNTATSTFNSPVNINVVNSGQGGLVISRNGSTPRIDVPGAVGDSFRMFSPGRSSNDTVSGGAYTDQANAYRVFEWGMVADEGTVTSNNSRSSIVFTTTVGSGSGSDSKIGLWTSRYGVSRAERLTIDPDGNVGVSSTTPYAKLSVTNIGTNPSLLIEDSVSPDSTPFIVDASGNVGIGTTTPANIVHVSGNNPYLAVDSANAGNGGFKLLKQSSEKWRIDNISVDDRLRFLSNITTEVMSLTQGGNVGISTTTPIARLSFADSVSQTGGIQFGSETSLYRNAVGSLTLYANTATTTLQVGLPSVAGASVIKVQGNGSAKFLQIDRDNNGAEYIRLGSGTAIGPNNTNFFDIVGTPNLRPLVGRFSSDAGVNFTTDWTWTPGHSYNLAVPLTVSTTTGTSSFSTGGFTIGSNRLVVQQGSGSVGIGTSSPTNLFTVANGPALLSSAAPLFNFYETGGTGNRNASIFLDAGSFSVFSGATNSTVNDLAFRVGDTSVFSSEVMRLTAANNVGIGTTTPSARLSVVNTSGVTFQLDKPTGAALQFSRDGVNGYQIDDSSGAMRWLSSGTTERMRLTASGDLGVGTTTPQAALSVAGDLNLQRSGGGSNFYIQTPVTDTRLVTLNSTPILLGANGNTSQLVLQTSGNVGIGTTSPSQALSVTGNAYVTGTLGVGTIATLAPVQVASRNPTYGHATFGGINDAGAISFRRASDGSPQGGIGYSSASESGTLDITANGGSGNMRFFVAGPQVATFSTIGNFGIGTTTPAQRLSVQGDALISGNLTAANLTATGTIITSGILPSSDLAVDIGSVSARFLTMYTSNLSSGNNSITIGAGTSGNGSINFTTDSGTNRMRIVQSTGNVGIGTTSPYQKLSVAGNVIADIFIATSTTGTSTFAGGATFATGSGNIGIGTSNPTAKLSVVMGFDASSGSGNGITVLDNQSRTMFSTGVSNGGQNLAVNNINPASNVTLSTDFGGSKVTLNRAASSADEALVFGTGGSVQWSLGHWGTDANNDFSIFNGGLSGTKVLTVLKSNGNIGIGTTTPDSRLTISDTNRDMTSGLSNATFYSTTVQGAGVGSSIQFGGLYNSSGAVTTFAGIKGSKENSTDSNTGGQLSLFTRTNAGAMTERMTIDSTGNVGIGTTTPSARFAVSVASNSAFASRIYNAGGDGRGLQIEASDGSGTNPLLSIITTGGTSHFEVEEGGNVGIGTTSPEAKLTVNGTVTTNGLITSYATGEVFRAINGGTGPVAARFGNSNNDFYIGIEGNTGGTYFGGSLANSSVLYSTRAVQTIIGGVSRVIVDTAGNVGIGTTSPTNILHLSATNPELVIDAAAAGSPRISFQNASTERFTVGMLGNDSKFRIVPGDISNTPTAVFDTLTGNVGVGTTTPTGKLNVYNSTSASGSINDGTLFIDQNHSGTVPSQLTIRGASGSGNQQLMLGYNTTSDYGSIQVYKQTDSAKNLVLQAVGGNVGIGTTTPNSKLTVTSSSGANVFQITSPDYNHGITSTLPTNVAFSHEIHSSEGNVLRYFSNDGTFSPLTIHGISGSTDPTDSVPGIVLNASKRTGTTQTNLASAETVLRVDNWGTTGLLTVLGGGNVGIGTTSPFMKLSIESGGIVVNNPSTVGSVRPSFIHIQNGFELLKMYDKSGSADSYVRNPSANLFLGNISNEQLVSLVGSNVGIGSTSPAQTLSVQGNGYIVGGLGVGVVNTNAGTIQTTGNISILGGNSLQLNNAANDAAATIANIGTAGTSKITFRTASTDRLVVDTLGNVGVGTTTPGFKLDVFGASRIGGSNPALYLTGTKAGGNEWIAQTVDTDGRFRILDNTNAAERVTVTQTGNVGIGTTTPDRKLSVSGGNVLIASAGNYPTVNTALNVFGNNQLITVEQDGNFGAGSAGIQFVPAGSGASSGLYRMFGSPTAGAYGSGLIFEQGGTSIGSGIFRAKFDANGNLGIGTTTPFVKLSVVGDTYIGGNFTATGTLSALSTVTAPNFVTSSSSATSTFEGGVRLAVSGGNVIIGGASATSNHTLGIAQSSAMSSMIISDLGGRELAFTSNRNIYDTLSTTRTLIGIQDSRDLLLRSTQADTASRIVLAPGSAGNVNIPQGNLGIGTTTPVGKLAIAGSGHHFVDVDVSGGAILRLNSNTIGNFKGLRFSYGSGYTGLWDIGYFGSTDSTNFDFANGTGIKASLDANGDFGVGTTSPWGKLSVTNTGSGPSFIVEDSTSPDSTPFIVDANGNVGVGTVTPVNKLTVQTTSSNFGISHTDGTARLSTYVGTSGGSVPLGGYIGTETNHPFYVYTNGSGPRFTVDTSGNIGIGTTTPTARLAVTGAGASTGRAFVVADSNNIERMRLNDVGTSFAVGSNLNDGVIGDGFHYTFNGAFSSVSLVSQQPDISIWSNPQSSNQTTLTGTTAYADASGISFSSGQGAAIYSPRNTGNLVIPSGNVGIGTTTPTARLSVVNTSGVTFQLDKPSGAALQFSRDGVNGYQIDDSSGAMRWLSSGTTERMRLTASGDLGVGATNPQDKLEVAGNIRLYNTTVDNEIIFQDNNIAHGLSTLLPGTAGTSIHARIKTLGGSPGGIDVLGVTDQDGASAARLYGVLGITDPTDTVPAVVLNGAKANTTDVQALASLETVLQVQNNTSALMTVLGNGNTGIGTTSPFAPLSVYVNANTPVAHFGTGVGNAQVNIMRSSQSTGQATLALMGGTGSTNWQVYLPQNSNDLRFFGNSADRMTITSSGNVGIGTTTPLTYLPFNASPAIGLDVYNATNGAIAVGGQIADFYMYDTNASTNQKAFNMRLNGNALNMVSLNDAGSITNNLLTLNMGTGNVGVGTTSPYQNFAVSGNAIITGNLQVSNGAGQATPSLVLREGDTDTGIYSPGTDEVGITTAGSIKLTVKSTGNVGIGTTSPTAKLSVEGTDSSMGWIKSSYAGGVNFTVEGTHDLAIPLFQIVDSGAGGGTWNLESGRQNGSFSIYGASGGPGQVFTITQAGNVGIGTTTPEGTLHIYGGVNNVLIAESRNPYSNSLTMPHVIRSISENTISDGFGAGAIFQIGESNGLPNQIGAIGFVRSGNSSSGDFVISPATNTNLSEKMRVTKAGLVGIGTSTPVSTLSVQGSLCVRDTGSCGTTAGTIYATTASITDIDLAENYPTLDLTLTAGEIVSVDTATSTMIKRAVAGERVLGIVSTAPGLLLGKEVSNSKPVALSGRVPVKVNGENGNIAIGDHIALSATPGVGRKAGGSEETVGIALEAWSGGPLDQGFVTVFVATKQTFAQEQFKIDGSGNVGIGMSGTSTPTYKLQIMGDVAATSFVNISTRDAKHDITYLDDATKATMLAKLKTIGVATYRYNTESDTAPMRLGLIAEEAPVEVLAAGGKGVDVYKLSTFILAGVQELDRKFESLEMKVNENTQNIALINQALASTTAALADLQNRLALVASSTATVSTASTTIVWSNDFTTSLMAMLETAGLKLQDGIAYIKNAIVETLTANIAYIKNAAIESASVGALQVGTTEHRAGITLYDEITGQPYCLKVSGGSTVSTFGACTPLVPPANGVVSTGGDGNQVQDNGTAGNNNVGNTTTGNTTGGEVTGGDTGTTTTSIGDTTNDGENSGETTPNTTGDSVGETTSGDSGSNGEATPEETTPESTTPEPTPVPEPAPAPTTPESTSETVTP